jgi:(2Fe-2S) ferredoxin
MKRILFFLMAGALVVLLGTAFAGEKCSKSCPSFSTCVGAEGKAVSLEGEIVEAGCYLAKGETAKDNAECIKKCAAEGMPLVLVTKDKSIYLIVKNADAEKAYAQAVKLAAQPVEIKGIVHEKDGLKAISVVEIKQLELASK